MLEEAQFSFEIIADETEIHADPTSEIKIITSPDPGDDASSARAVNLDTWKVNPPISPEATMKIACEPVMSSEEKQTIEEAKMALEINASETRADFTPGVEITSMTAKGEMSSISIETLEMPKINPRGRPKGRVTTACGLPIKKNTAYFC